MSEHQSDADWEFFAKDNPYWAVLTQERFRKRNLDETAKGDFFASGEEYINWVFGMVRKHVDPAFNPRSALDFGCGVGRLVIPLAGKCNSAVGVDVSETMLREAQAACEAKSIRNVRLVQGLDKLSDADRNFDFINSFIVFQHIPCERGLSLFRQLVGLLADGGVGAVQVTYSLAGYSNMNELMPTTYLPRENNEKKDERPLGLRYPLSCLKQAISARLSEAWSRKSAGVMLPQKATAAPPPTSQPTMQMNPYLLNPILHCLQEAGVREFHTVFSDHSGSRGAVLFFQKRSAAPYAKDFLFES